MKIKQLTIIFVGVAAALTLGTAIYAQHFSGWAVPVNAESIPGTSQDLNTASNEGYPIESPDGLSLYLVSDRPGTLGGFDIWVSKRDSVGDPWSAPQNAGSPINSSFLDWAPTPVPGHGLYFVSSRPHPNACGGDDIYFTRFRNGAWDEPENLGCQINSSAAESGPSYFEDENGHGILYFSSNRAGGFAPDVGPADPDIYFSIDFGPAQLAPGLNTATNDVRPFVSKEGLEVFFDSARTGGQGGLDIWTSTRESTGDDWTTPENPGAIINSPATDARPTLSRDGLTMYFGSGRTGNSEGGSDLFVTTREKLKGNEQ